MTDFFLGVGLGVVLATTVLAADYAAYHLTRLPLKRWSPSD